MDTTQITWPSYFPDQCPPSEARRDTLKAYRLVSTTPPTADDFVPPKLETPHRPFNPQLLCQSCGVSVYKEINDVLLQKQKWPKLKFKMVALIEIKESDGAILETPSHGNPVSSHVTWWLQTENPQHSFLEIINS